MRYINPRYLLTYLLVLRTSIVSWQGWLRLPLCALLSAMDQPLSSTEPSIPHGSLNEE